MLVLCPLTIMINCNRRERDDGTRGFGMGPEDTDGLGDGCMKTSPVSFYFPDEIELQ